MPKLTKPLGNDTDSFTTDRATTQNHKIGEIPNNCVKEEPKGNRAQQLPNKDPEHPEIKDWLNQEWNKAERNAWDHYFWPSVTGYGENISAMQEKGKAKGGNHLWGMAKYL